MRLLTWLLAVSLGLAAAAAMLAATLLWPPRLGIDLGGGQQLVYAIAAESADGNETATADTPIDWRNLIRALDCRLNPYGNHEVRIRQCGRQKVEVTISHDPARGQYVRSAIATAGVLEMRIIANQRDHRHLITLALQQAQDPELARRTDPWVTDQDGNRLGHWVTVEKTKIKARELTLTVARNSNTGQRIDCSTLVPELTDDRLLSDCLNQAGIADVDVLVAVDDGCDVTGDNLQTVAAGVDEYLSPCVNFRLSPEGAIRMKELTSRNAPDLEVDPPFYRHLGIILDDQLLTLPRLITAIGDSGRITGYFTAAEVDLLVGVLRAGRLPVQVDPMPVRESQLDPDPTALQVVLAGLILTIGAVLIAALVMQLWHGQHGLVASLALMLQGLAMLLIIQIRQIPVTLPVLAAAMTVTLCCALWLPWICAAASQRGAGKPGPSRPSMPGRVVVFGIVLAALLAAGTVISLLPGSAAVGAGSVLWFGSFTAFGALCVTVLAIVAQLSTGTPEK